MDCDIYNPPKAHFGTIRSQPHAGRWSLVYRMFRRYTPEYEQHAFVHVNIAKHIATKPDHRTIFHNIS